MTEFQIVKWFDANTVLWKGTAENMREAVIAAVAADANLGGADLRDADLHDADLRDADLRGADLGGADLHDADLRDADLRDADLRDADLRDADLRGADLRDADLGGADLHDADLRDADLSAIRDDIWAVLSAAPGEVAGLLAAVREGRINGSSYSGDCACLVGTIANVRGCSIDSLGPLKANSSRPAEMWFLNIHPGDRPDDDHFFAKQAEGWIAEWLTNMQAAFGPKVSA